MRLAYIIKWSSVTVVDATGTMCGLVINPIVLTHGPFFLIAIYASELVIIATMVVLYGQQWMEGFNLLDTTIESTVLSKKIRW
jgi:hypothetical protein